MSNNPIDCNVLLRLIGAHGRFSPQAKVAIDGPRIGCGAKCFRAFCSADTTLPVDPRANVGGKEIPIKPAWGSLVLLLWLSVPVTRSRQERPRQFGKPNTPTWAQQEMKTWKSLMRR